jgi:predicted O-methyltransferase YrrM
MNQDRQRLAERLFEQSRAHDAAQSDRLSRFRNVEPATAVLLNLLVVAGAPKQVLELGTSNGYSTIWLGDACEHVGAAFVSVDNDAGRAQAAAENLRAAGLDVALEVDDAGRVLGRSQDAAWDFVFLDAERDAYASYWPDLRRILAPCGLLVIDNVLSHEDEVAEVTALIRADPGVLSAVVPVGAGLLLVAKP